MSPYQPQRLEDRRAELCEAIEDARQRAIDAVRKHDDEAWERWSAEAVRLMRRRLTLDTWCAALGPPASSAWYMDVRATA